MSRSKATYIGFCAVLLWALLALFTVGSAPMPPLQLNAVCFGIATVIGVIWVARSGGFTELRRVRWYVYVFGITGLFGYHLLYFTALRLAPAAEAGLIAYLWPLLIVLFSGLLPGEQLRAGHILGALVSFAGAALIIARSGASFDAAAMPGYLAAGLCALTWSSYSVLSRRLGNRPTNTVAVYCAGAAVLSLVAHLAFEETVWPESALSWASAAALGLGPVGLAFYVWDIGMKQGDIQLLGVASYAAPLLSTVVLIAAGYAAASATLILAAVLIAGGALLAARAGN